MLDRERAQAQVKPAPKQLHNITERVRSGGSARGTALPANPFLLSGMVGGIVAGQLSDPTTWGIFWPLCLAIIVLALVGAVRHGMFWRAHPMWTHLTVYAATIFAAVVLLTAVGGSLDRTRLRPALWFIFLILGGAIGLIAPGGIIFFLFPPLVALVGMVASRWWKPAELVGAIAALILLYVTWGEMLALLEELLNQGPMWIFAILGSLIIVPLLIQAKPLLDKVDARAAVALCGAVAVLGWAVSAASPATSADRQQRFVIEHVTDTDAGKAYWSVINDHSPLPPAYRSVGAWKWTKLPNIDRLRWLAPAPAVAGIGLLAALGPQGLLGGVFGRIAWISGRVESLSQSPSGSACSRDSASRTSTRRCSSAAPSRRRSC